MIPASNIELLQEHISLDQQGYISIEFIEKRDIHEFVALFTKIKRLIELCVLNTIDVTQISAFNSSIYDEYGDLKVPREIEIISSMKGIKNTEKEGVHVIKWLRLPELISNNSFSLYIDKYEKMEPIVELYIETVYNRTMSPVRRFFNIVQALETYHSRFVTNDMEIFRDRIDNIILSQVPEENKEPYRKLLLAEPKKFITLRSRIADLMVANFEIISSSNSSVLSIGSTCHLILTFASFPIDTFPIIIFFSLLFYFLLLFFLRKPLLSADFLQYTKFLAK